MRAVGRVTSWLALLHVTQCMVLHRPRITPGRALPVALCASPAPEGNKRRGGMKRGLKADSSVKTAAQLKVLRSALTCTLLFRGLDEPSLDRILQSMVRLEVRMLLLWTCLRLCIPTPCGSVLLLLCTCPPLLQVPQGHEVIRQGDKGDLFYVVERGEFDVFVADGTGAPRQRVHTYAPAPENDRYPCFGELALMYAAPRQASVVAASAGGVACRKRIEAGSKHRSLQASPLPTAPDRSQLPPYGAQAVCCGVSTAPLYAKRAL